MAFNRAPIIVATCLLSTPVMALSDADAPSLYDQPLSQMQASAAMYDADSERVIDLVAFYLPLYAVLIGEEAVHERIAYKVDVANEVFSNSGNNTRINLVAVTPTFGIPDDRPFSDVRDGSGNIIQDGAQYLFSVRLLNKFEGHTENEFYTAFGADLATHFRPYRPLLDGTESLGKGALEGQVSYIFDRITSHSNPTYQDTTLAHEIGHNLGGGHEEGESSPNNAEDANAYSCGGKNTVMWSATVTNGDGGKHRIFSNPDIERGGEYCGESGFADNSAVLDRNAPLAAARRNRPSVLGAVSLQDSQITVNEMDGEFSVALVRNGDISEEASVGVLIKGETASTVYNLKQAYQFVTFGAGESIASATFGVVNDAIEQGDMTASINLMYPNRLTVESGTAELVIQDSPAGNPGEIVIEAPKRVALGDTISFDVVRKGGFDGELVVHIRTDYALGQTIPYEILYPFDDNLIFADGQERMTFEIPTKYTEGVNDRAFTLVAETVALDAPLSSAIVAIDAGAVSYDIEANTDAKASTYVEAVVTRTGDTTKETAVHVTSVDGSLKVNEHYRLVDEWVEFEADETTKTVRVQLVTPVEAGTFSLELDTGSSVTMDVAALTVPETSTKERGAASFHPFYVLLLVLTALIRMRPVARKK